MIILFGSNVLDLFFHLADIPGPDQAVHLTGHEERPGGKGANQAVAAARAGSDVAFFGAIGSGGHGRQMQNNLADEGIDVSGMDVLEDMPSGLATIFVDDSDGTHRVVVSQGANLNARQSTVSDDILNGQNTLLVQRELPIEETVALIKRAKNNGVRTIMNLAPAEKISEETLRDLDYIILNEHEAESLAASLSIDMKGKWAFSKYLFEVYNITPVITLGAAGSICYSQEGLYELNTLTITPIDTIGAGDAFSGYFSASLDQGRSIKDALTYAAVASCLTCTKLGAMTALPKKEDVEKRLSEIQVNERELSVAA